MGETHAENYLEQAENSIVNRGGFFKQEWLVACVVILKQNYLLQLN